jgi:hypothetical protein
MPSGRNVGAEMTAARDRSVLCRRAGQNFLRTVVTLAMAGHAATSEYHAASAAACCSGCFLIR